LSVPNSVFLSKYTIPPKISESNQALVSAVQFVDPPLLTQMLGPSALRNRGVLAEAADIYPA
jgi:hypothetical protein